MRSKNKIFRLTELQLEQLEKHIEKEETTFTDFIRKRPLNPMPIF